MSGYFFDTSALVKHYHPEVGSDKVWKILFDANHRCFVSRLGMLETQIVFAAKVRGGFISDAEFLKYRHYLFTDASRRLFRIIGSWVATTTKLSALLDASARLAGYEHWMPSSCPSPLSSKRAVLSITSCVPIRNSLI